MGKADRQPARKERADASKIERMRANLLAWYEANRRDLPWRRTSDPYAIWVSEIMLQQTRVAVVVERFKSFLARFPSVRALSLAAEQDVLAEWSGLGYYRRARMLHKAAQFLSSHRGGVLPSDSAALRALPGIGAYTAAAIASIAHGEAVAAVDGNVERVLCRVEGWGHGDPDGVGALRRRIDVRAQALVHPRRPGSFNQAMMELGAVLCTPRAPQCPACPLAGDCKTRGEHKAAPRPRMTSRRTAFALSLRTPRPGRPAAREVLLDRRAGSETVMPSMWELPALREADFPDDELHMVLRHAIMRVNYYVRIREVPEQDGGALAPASAERRWVPLAEAAALPLTGVARKVLMRARLFAPGASIGLP